MDIKKIRLQNFKNFSDLEVEFYKGVNLFVGGNGSGKTSILEAINVALGGFFGSQEQKMQRFIDFSEIRIENGERLEYSNVYAESTFIQNSWSRTIKRNTKKNDSKNSKAASEFGEAYYKDFLDKKNILIAPLIVYYSTKRLFNTVNFTIKNSYDPYIGRKIGYISCLDENSIQKILNDWLGKAVTDRATLAIKEIDKKDLVLQNVEEALEKTLIFFSEKNENFKIKIYLDSKKNEVFVNYDKIHDLPLSYYSDGFRNLIYLIFDLVWRASQLNPWLSLDEIAENVTGVVTIDEIDLHLHPKWQAKSIGILQKLFPKVQFFITTHSPTVLSNFENGTVYVVQNDKIEKFNGKYFARDINDILVNVLGASDRHKPTQEKLDSLFRLIDDGKAEEYNSILLTLTTLLGEDDFDIIKANTLIEMNAINNQS